MTYDILINTSYKLTPKTKFQRLNPQLNTKY